MPTSPMSEVVHYLRSAVLPDGADLSDGQLLERFLSRREPAALEALMRRHGPMVWGLCRRILDNHHDAEDAFQAVFLVLVRKEATIRSRAQVGNWLYGVAHQTALKARATRARRRGREMLLAHVPEPAATERDGWSDVRLQLDQEVSRLPAKYRTAIVLCELEGKTVREAAQQLGLPQGTVASRLGRAKAMLAKRLAKYGLGVSGGVLAAVLPPRVALAFVPTSVVASTVQAASLVAAGQAAAGLIPATVAALTEGVLTSMLLTKIKTVTVVLLVAVAVVGSGGLLYRTQAAETVAEEDAQAEKDRKQDRKSLKRSVEEAERAVERAAAELDHARERLRRLKQIAAVAETPNAKEKEESPVNSRPAPQGAEAGDDDDVADVPSEDLRAGKDENKRYFLIGPGRGARRPKDGYGLVVILPGGAGSADFHPFVKRIYKHAIPDGYLVAQPVAIKWTAEQAIVWPTAKNPAEKMKFSTEEFVVAVIKDVGAKHAVNPQRVFTLSWSSSGPAAYAISLADKRVTGSFIAMSVFNPRLLPPLAKAKGHAYYLYHSPDDRVCPYRMAKQAAEDLETNHAKVKLMTYAGGHGWRGDLYQDIRDGIKWLEENHATPANKGDQPDKEDTPKKDTAGSDKERIQGTWRLVKAEVNGVEVTPFLPPKEGFRATLTGTKWTSNFMEGEGFTFQLDPASRPKAIDLHPLEDVDRTLLGIYQLAGDDLTICFCQRGKQERPSAFENYWRAGSHTALLVLKRQADGVNQPRKD